MGYNTHNLVKPTLLVKVELGFDNDPVKQDGSTITLRLKQLIEKVNVASSIILPIIAVDFAKQNCRKLLIMARAMECWIHLFP